MQTRQARAELKVYTMGLEKRTIPANAILHDFRVGPGHEGLAPFVTDVASFQDLAMRKAGIGRLQSGHTCTKVL